MMTAADLYRLIKDITYLNWMFRVGIAGDGFYLQVVFDADGKGQHGRKWYISRHATRSEVVQTALKAVLTAEEHEAREHFRYRGEAIFSPHFDVDEAAERHGSAKQDRRTEVA